MRLSKSAVCVLCAIASLPLAAEEKDMSLSLSSAAFSHQGIIPSRYTCNGEDISPQLSWAGAPAGTKSFVLVMDDPDAPDPASPRITWVHWVLYNIPSTIRSLLENISANGLPSGTLEGINNWSRTGYGGPCPPIGQHRYFFKLYALDVVLPDLKQPDKAKVEKAMREHVIAHAELIGRYPKMQP